MEKENNTLQIRTHRVGSITAGLSMVAYGILLLLHTLFELVSYDLIFSLWPLILIGLGLELLLSNFLERKIVYDKGAVFILIIITFFVMAMACADICMEATELYMSNVIIDW